MNLKAAFFATALCCVLAGCITVNTGEPMPMSARKCSNTEACQTAVSVDSFMVFWRRAAVADQTLELNGARSVTWALASAGYQFADNGIEFSLKPGGKDPSGLFDCTKSQDSMSFTCSVSEKAGKGSYYAYTLRLVGPDNPYPLDPWIKN